MHNENQLGLADLMVGFLMLEIQY